jgi:hypothetical protein
VLGNVSVTGGGGGANCNTLLPALGPPPFPPSPPYGDFENMTIGGNLTIIGWQSCWLGVFRVTVGHNVGFDGNVTGALGDTGLPDATRCRTIPSLAT